MHGILPKWLKYKCMQQLSRVLCLGMHSYVMLRFMVQALQDPPLCSSTEFVPSMMCSWMEARGALSGAQV